MDIKNRFYMLLLFCCSTISLTAQRDSISIDPRWNYWHVDAIAPNGDWAFVYQIFPNDRIKKNKRFAVNTDSKKRVDITKLHYLNFTNNNFLLGAKDSETIEVDLISQRQTSLGVLKQKDWIEEKQTLCYVNEQNELVLKQYSKKSSRIILNKKGISKYYLNPSKTRLLYQEEGNSMLYQFELQTLKEKELDHIDDVIHNITWSFEENSIVAVLKNSNIKYLKLDTSISKRITLPKAKASNLGVQISFFSNDDFLIKYLIDNAIKDSTKDYLDIWNGNNRELKYKVLEKNEGELKAFVYSQSTDKLTELPRSEKQDYLNIGIPNYMLVFEPLELQDYSQVFENVRYRVLDLKTLQEKGDLTTAFNFGSLYNRSPNNKHILYPNKESWEIYDFENQKRTIIPHTDTRPTPFWTSDSKLVFYQDGQNIIVYNLENKQTKAITNFKKKNRFRFVNTIRKLNSTYLKTSHSILFVTENKNYQTSYYSLIKNKLTKLVDSSKNKLNTRYLSNGISIDGKTVVWTEENYNQPPTVKVYREGKVSTLLEPEVPEELYSWRKQKVIQYKDKFGVDLAGILWYPKEYNPIKKYPMVTMIYERQGHLRSEFEISTLHNQHGFSRALLNDEGYFIFQPDTYVSDEGPGLSALECVTKGIEAITAIEPAIDKTKIGLIGHSFGGYKTSFILGNSSLFTAGISGAGIHHLISFNYEYNYYRMLPNSFIVENEQWKMNQSFAENPSKYNNNSPIHFAQNFETPVLLWTGLKDNNVTWENTRHMYIALQRYKKPVIALFYKNENHTLSYTNEQKDLTYRVLDWFDYYLKEKKEIEWINKGIDYNTY